MRDYEIIIGLEIHVQLQTRTKIFCVCKNEFQAEPNTNTCPVCLGMPGALPVLNKKAVELACRFILAVGGDINNNSLFARKNYFYPDLPKGYQISQHERPLGKSGTIRIETEDGMKEIMLQGIHLEEDAGKSFHLEDSSNIDFNRCGTPLLEIVTMPVIKNAHEAYLLLYRIRQLVQYLEISSGDMEKGALRCDANVSVRPQGQHEYGIRTEVKNMNSIRGVERALSYEISRQINLLEEGGFVVQETRLWDESMGRTDTMRTKEESPDYRYFPEPDLLALELEDDWLEEIKETIPELPLEKRDRFVREYKIPPYDAGVLTITPQLANYFEETARLCGNPKQASNWIMTEIMKIMKDRQISPDELNIPPKNVADLIKSIENGTISGKIAKEIVAEMAASGKAPGEIIEAHGLEQITDKKVIEQAVEQVFRENPENLKRYFDGQDKLFGYFVGQVMIKTEGKANPHLVNEILKDKLDGR
ncbi:MAG: Asp-tRNA(Asn)/Glu-tRNA(Gln) amidotransferase subunit GatB [candidate division Zixibacteria bacterium]|nr:Asp-tRNA(Asn)/Glu-tRNA(Gln) amidotransferase subunit GatB [candidate division Zixibacteria bacterium]NIR63258.1 Asp-tRNA(Asn)/Glu-tRNA(Gln) amidotransferase subunit GatB [candidate division Zixibacteria bacterium]NIS17118.1 Asp-tRNA(Asn)/Glu-tRNA(Gln) amidotransferase subunit GatB [candidate division Zixibacteria bacterium]NIS45239.1 Asp-tRNA(Asn)/Glu-tRNA(Gln) amidotransferase subunit GatB [candidate division Zixibacteria bacterium]NIT53470.1 Asp-tRNA(Asn)/Glu-tRNA(Gln) amidotransferase sub